jgi:demethylmenaquinone methyltransferase/2-methoxy-6-polyprenyl-1,4-benzoquinol methylase
LPFPDRVFDAVVSAFMMRYIRDLAAGFREQLRVVRPGGRVVCLETSPPPRGPLAPILTRYLRHIVPLVGQLAAGAGETYRFLPESTFAFPRPSGLSAQMRTAGLAEVAYRTFMWGTVTVAWGRRPEV